MRIRRVRATILLASVLLCLAASASDPRRAPPYPSRLSLHGVEPARAPRSAWLESRAQLYRQALEPRRHEILVVPFQVQGYAVDAIERSLMTRHLVDALEREGLRVANPDSVEHALGGPQQRHQASPDDLAAYFELAIRMRVGRVVIGHAGHLLGDDFRVTVQTFDQDERGGFPAAPSRVWDRDALPLSDTELPSQIFGAQLAAVAASVLGEPPSAKQGDRSEAGSPEPGLPGSPEALVAREAQSALEAAHQLQLLAALHPPGRASERLFERSLVALARTARDAPHRALLEARAWWHLHRRPAALVALGGAEGPEAAALRGLLDGNLESSGRGLDAIRSPLLRFHARLEHRFLQRAYGDRALALTERALVSEAPEGWRPFAQALLGGFSAELTGELAHRLERDFPVPDFDLRGQLAADALVGEPFASERSLRLAPRRLADRLLEVARDAPLQSEAYFRPHRADLLELLLAAAEETLFSHLLALVATDERRALAEIEDYAGLYAEHPRLEAVRFRWLSQSAERAPRNERAQREQQARALAQRIQLWEGGQTALTTRLPRTGLYDPDFPTHPDWFWPFETPELLGMEGRHGQVDGLWSVESHLAYTTASVASLEHLHGRLLAAGQAQAASELVKRNAHRFLGHPKRPAFLAPAPPDPSDPLAAAALAIARGTTAWGPYQASAQPHLARGELSQASEIYRRYPRFREKKWLARPDEELALQAWEAGSEFFWRGDGALATPFFEIAAKASPRSSAGLGSRFRIELLEERWSEAANTARVRTADTKSTYAVRDFLMMLHVLGAGSEAWSVFERASLESEDPELWTAALVGHRIEGRSDAEIVAWLVDPRRARTQGMLRHFLLFSLLQDRVPTEEWSGLVRAVHSALVSAMPDVREVRLTPEQFAELVMSSSAEDAGLLEFSAAWKRGDHAAAWKLLRRGRVDLGRRSSLVPYAAWAAAATGNDAVFDADLDAARRGWDEQRRFGQLDERGLAMDMALAQAVRAGLRGDHERALAALEAARHARAYTQGRLFLTWHQLLEICDALHRATGHDPYRVLALDWARRHTRIQPMFGFAWALVARHTDSDAERAGALRAALFLDRRSALLEGISASELAAARSWLEEHTPFPAAKPDESVRHTVSRPHPARS